MRSSGVDETIDCRGALESTEGSVTNLIGELQRLQRAITVDQVMHWVVQEFVPLVAKGHLSNERRIAQDK